MDGLLTKCEVKMAGYWQSSSSRSINSEKRTRPISSHVDRTSLVNKGFIICLSRKFFLRDTAGSPKRARWLHLARSGSQSHRAIWVILPARAASHIISMDYSPSVRSRWLDIGRVLFLRVYGPRRSRSS